ncbi:unnamed protein product, partial [Heterosigma akashiwo]
MMAERYEEISALELIYDEDFEWISRQGALLVFRITINNLSSDSNKESFALTVRVPEGYPHSLHPSISLSVPSLASSSVSYLNKAIKDKIAILPLGREILFEVLTVSQEELNVWKDQQLEVGEGKIEDEDEESLNEISYTNVLYLDHMRDEKLYTRKLSGWAQDLGLTGAVVFKAGSKRNVHIFIEGSDGGLKAFMKRLRTENVDVDSKGRSCRERMMSVVAEK